jgi:tetratricopeptide (TPR) repeat protein
MRISGLLLLLSITLIPTFTSAQTNSSTEQKIAAEWKKGQDAMNSEDYKTAKAAFDKVISLGSNDSGAFFNRGYAETILAHGGDSSLDALIHDLDPKQLDPAIADFSKAIQLKSDDADAYLYRGICYKAQGNWSLALTDAKKAASLNPEYQVFADAMQGSQLQYLYYLSAFIVGGLVCAFFVVPFVKSIAVVTAAEKAGRGQ